MNETAGLGHAPRQDTTDDPQALKARVAGLEAAVQNFQEQLSGYERVFFENPVPAIVYDPVSLRILEANQSASALYGYTRDQLQRLTLNDLFVADARRNQAELFIEFGKPINSLGPFTHRTASNQELVVSMVFFTFQLRDTDARIVMIQDETARHIAEEALRGSEERFRELFENANDVIFLHDLKGKIIAVNRAAEYLTGYARQEVVGQNFEELVAPEARYETQDSIRAHL
ncbi:MAG: PAS domain S-box protein, partial [Acidobacteriaceae bacterium]|nr:PAS domain S-box protein [Acidobacteriaceae bacterium]